MDEFPRVQQWSRGTSHGILIGSAIATNAMRTIGILTIEHTKHYSMNQRYSDRLRRSGGRLFIYLDPTQQRRCFRNTGAIEVDTNCGGHMRFLIFCQIYIIQLPKCFILLAARLYICAYLSRQDREQIVAWCACLSVHCHPSFVSWRLRRFYPN